VIVMTVRRCVILLAAIVSLGGRPAIAGDEPLQVRISPAMSAAPAFIRVHATVKPHEANRALEIAADSGTFFRSSLVQLDGSRAPVATDSYLKNLPAGTYEVTVTLVTATGPRSTQRRTVIVVGGLEDR
jgi:hypothetical protein